MEEADNEAIPRIVGEELRSLGYATGDETFDAKRAAIEGRVSKRRAEQRRKSIVLFLPNGRKLTVNSLKEAFIEPSLARETPVGFHILMRGAEISVDLQIDADLPEYLRIDVERESDPVARQIFADLYDWALAVKPPRWQELWSAGFAPFIAWPVYVMVALITLQVAFNSDSKAALRREAYAILKDGISASEERRALEVTLALVSDYELPSARATGLTPRTGTLLLTGLAICIVLSITPKFAMGIGHGQIVVHRWRWWLRFVFYTIPAALAANFAWPMLQELLSRALKG